MLTEKKGARDYLQQKEKEEEIAHTKERTRDYSQQKEKEDARDCSRKGTNK